MRLRRKKEKNERRQPIRSDGTSLARFLEVVALIAAIGLLMAPTAVMALYGGGFPEGWQAAPFQLPFACWGMVWQNIETAVPALSALLQCLCLAFALRFGAQAARSRAYVEQECAKLNWTAAFCLVLAGLFTISTGWDTAFSRNPWALLGLIRTVVALIAAYFVRRYGHRLSHSDAFSQDHQNLTE